MVVVKALSVAIVNGIIPQSARSSSSEGYSWYLQGRSLWERGDSLTNVEAETRALEQAEKLDPAYAPVWATLTRARVASYFDYGL